MGLCPTQIADLEVRLEIAVVVDLLVDLQTVALAVRDDDAIGRRIELYRRREAEAILRFEALHAASSRGHVGVGVNGLLAHFGNT